MTKRGKKPKFQMVCETCGSTRVTRDAWAEWDADEQEWQLATVYDHAYCHRCEGETNIEEKVIE